MVKIGDSSARATHDLTDTSHASKSEASTAPFNICGFEIARYQECSGDDKRKYDAFKKHAESTEETRAAFLEATENDYAVTYTAGEGMFVRSSTFGIGGTNHYDQISIEKKPPSPTLQCVKRVAAVKARLDGERDALLNKHDKEERSYLCECILL